MVGQVYTCLCNKLAIVAACKMNLEHHKIIENYIKKRQLFSECCTCYYAYILNYLSKFIWLTFKLLAKIPECMDAFPLWVVNLITLFSFSFWIIASKDITLTNSIHTPISTTSV